MHVDEVTFGHQCWCPCGSRRLAAWSASKLCGSRAPTWAPPAADSYAKIHGDSLGLGGCSVHDEQGISREGEAFSSISIAVQLSFLPATPGGLAESSRRCDEGHNRARSRPAVVV